MAKKDDRGKNSKTRLKKQIIINWVICGASLLAIILLRLYAQNH